MRANFDLPGAVARDELIRVDGLLKLFGVSGDAHQSKADWNDIVRKRRHLVEVFDLELARLVQGAVSDPEAQLRQLVELDGVAVVLANIVKSRELFDETVHKSLAVVVEARWTAAHEVVEAAA